MRSTAVSGLRIGLDTGYLGQPMAEGLRHWSWHIFSRMIRDNPNHHFTLIWTPPVRHAGEYRELLAPNTDVVTLIDKPLWRKLARRLGVFSVPGSVLRAVRGLDVLLWHDLTERTLRWLHRVPDTPKVVAIGDAIPVVFPEVSTKSFSDWMAEFYRGAVLSGSQLITLSEHAKADLCRVGGFDPARANVIYPGHNFDGSDGRPVPDSPLPADLSERLGNNPFVLTVGTLEPRKNHVRLFRAFRELTARPEFARWKLVAVGREGWLFDEILSEAAATPGVILAGRRTHEELAALYRHATVFAFPSLYEGFGLPVAEALSFGLPVLTSNTTSLPEVAGDAALLVDPSDADAIREGLGCLMASPDLRTKLAAAARVQAAEFSWDKAARETMRVLEQVAASHRTRGRR